MHPQRSSLSLLALTLLAGCATQPGSAPAVMPAATELAAAPLPQWPAASSARKAEPKPKQEETDAAPVIIRGNDQLLKGVSAGPGTIKGQPTSFNFQDAPTAEVVQLMLRDLLKVDYVAHPPLPGTITLVTRAPISADKAFNLLESALQINGVVLARDARGTYHVGTPDALSSIVAAPRVAGNGPLPPGYGAIVIPLEYLGAQEMANILQPLVKAGSVVRVDTMRNVLVMKGTRAEAEGWLDLVNTFDVNILRGMSVGVFPLKHTSPAEVQTALQMLSGTTPTGTTPPAAAAQGAAGNRGAGAQPTGVRPGAGAGGAAAAAAAAQPPVGANALGEGSPLFGAVRVMAIERINAVLVVTPRSSYLDEIRYWIEQFDRPNMNSAEPQLFVYKVQNGSSDHLAELLNGIYGGTAAGTGGTGATGVAPGLGTTSNTSGGFGGLGGGGGFGGGGGGFGTSGFGGAAFGANPLNRNVPSNQQRATVSGTTMLGQSVRVMADRINNTLLIHAKPSEYERIETTLKRLDIQRAQVLIEATIVEVSLGDGLEYGLQWAFNNGIGGTSYRGTGMLNNGTVGIPLPAGSTSFSFPSVGAGAGFSYALGNTAAGIKGILSALAQKSLVKVISSPSLLVLDNHAANISVGTQEPVNVGGGIVTGTVTTTGNIQYRDTGVMLGVTPSVNAGDLVTLDINQQVTDVLNGDTATQQPKFTQRQIQSQVAVRSGDTVVLGGLIKDNASTGSSGLPVLSSIPIIGGLFGKQEKKSSRTELLVIFTPRVVRSDEDVRAISRELRDRMGGLTASGISTLVPNPVKSSP
ncbi:type II secretion system secretin GspD [Ottowia thiooxydans]|uniref:type II secretion system secretin GspD n=1 Tax=Ottowia thiooxydans TaxID=219182 RepID=UPI0012EBF23E|nr:type II secretion system secretin GspD [Ottowia thiooxydans]